MPRGVNGTYTLPSGNPVISGTVIESNWANTTMPDIANALTDSLSRTGNGPMQAPLIGVDGSATNPSFAFIGDSDTGMYLGADGMLYFSAAGVQRFRITGTGSVDIWNVADAAWYPVASGANQGGVVEVQTLAAAQTVVPFTANVAGAAFYLDITSGDRGHIFAPDDYTYDALNNEITLTTSYPDGTKIYAVFNDETLVQEAAAAAAESANLSRDYAIEDTAFVELVNNSSKSWAVGGTGDGDPVEGSAKDWATETGTTVDGVEYSSKEYASGVVVPSGSSKDWAIQTGAMVDGVEWSSKEYAQGVTLTTGSAKQWASEAEDVPVAGGFSSLHWSAKAEGFAADAAASAASAASVSVALAIALG